MPPYSEVDMIRMLYGHTECAICRQVIRFGPSVIAGMEGGEPTGYAHADCWLNSGKTIICHETVAEWMGLMTNPRKTVFLESGHGLDAIGARPELDRPRNGIETDHDYRNRLIERMKEIDAQPESAG